MPRLRLRQTTTAENRHTVHVTFEGDGSQTRDADATFSFELTAQDREDLRWYLEDYLQCPLKPDDPTDPELIFAQGIEARLTEMGHQLFDFIFRDNEGAREICLTGRECDSCEKPECAVETRILSCKVKPVLRGRQCRVSDLTDGRSSGDQCDDAAPLIRVRKRSE